MEVGQSCMWCWPSLYMRFFSPSLLLREGSCSCTVEKMSFNMFYIPFSNVFNCAVCSTSHSTDLPLKTNYMIFLDLLPKLFFRLLNSQFSHCCMCDWNKTTHKCWYYTACKANGACVVLFTENKAAPMSFHKHIAWLTHQCLCSNRHTRADGEHLSNKAGFKIHFELFSCSS